MPTAVGVGSTSMFESVCLSVCMEHNSKTKGPKMFKLGMGNDRRILYKFYGFDGERSKVKVWVRVNNNAAWVRTL